MKPDDFYVEEFDTSPNAEPWAPGAWRFAEEMMDALRRGPLDGRDDVSVAMALSELLHGELECYGTSGNQRLDDHDLSAALAALRAVLRRLGIKFELPFRSYSTWRTYWNNNDGYGSWQARRDLLARLFEPLDAQLIRLEETMFEALADPSSPRRGTGWPLVDEEVSELRRRFRSASSVQDYRAVGTHCVGVLEALSRTVYDPRKHLREGETVPPPDKSKQRLGRYVEDSLGGNSNEELRGLVNKSIEFAHQVKHSQTPTRREAGIAADAVIMLANILRRLEQEF